MWPVKPTKRTLPSRFGAIEGVDDAAAREVPIGIVVVGALVHLPEIQVVGLEPLERLLELAHRHARVAPVGADLGHQEDTLAPIRDGAAHADLALVFVIFPGVVHERDAGIDRGVDEAGSLADRLDIAEVIATEPECRNRHICMTAERTQGDRHGRQA